ncbi:hypothetical protein [Pseudopontixanthobacter vadosimaris]|uniref:hypothetical protein n=1 Tax=Pseudopontixanthobacter vadosimaris TaxID=2726450 RepID=UPI0014750F90|nr:hypothetical protein [Pseudopontixanthobacter vadosimaris]
MILEVLHGFSKNIAVVLMSFHQLEIDAITIGRVMRLSWLTPPAACPILGYACQAAVGPVAQVVRAHA